MSTQNLENKTKKQSKLVKPLLLLFSLAIAFLIAEAGFRFILFSDIPGFESLRAAAGYADYFSDDDFWKLHYMWGHKPRSKLHPVLGWAGDFDWDMYLHDQAGDLNGRRPLLIFGDSFAGCSNDADCFEDILNADQEFSAGNYLLNYGVGSYGTDQILLLLQNAVPNYDNPFVVVSFMTLDMDRSLLSVRTAPKPYFRVEDGILILKGVPVGSSPHPWYEANPPEIKSYVFRRILYGYFPPNLVRIIRGDDRKLETKKEINEKIILEMKSTLESHDLDYVFLVFHPHVPGVSNIYEETDWRDPFLKQLFEENDIPYIWSKGLLKQVAGDNFELTDYFLDDGHPTTRFNQIISDEIKKAVLQSELVGN